MSEMDYVSPREFYNNPYAAPGYTGPTYSGPFQSTRPPPPEAILTQYPTTRNPLAIFTCYKLTVPPEAKPFNNINTTISRCFKIRKREGHPVAKGVLFECVFKERWSGKLYSAPGFVLPEELENASVHLDAYFHKEQKSKDEPWILCVYLQFGIGKWTEDDDFEGGRRMWRELYPGDALNGVKTKCRLDAYLPSMSRGPSTVTEEMKTWATVEDYLEVKRKEQELKKMSGWKERYADGEDDFAVSSEYED